MKLLIIEDEKELSNNIVTYLSSENYVCEQAFTYEEAQIKLDLYDYDCVLLDLMLLGGNGLDILRDIRRRHNPAGVIIVSAKDSLDDKVKGLEIGADDYLPKPFHLAELSMRIYAIIRRKAFASNNTLYSNNIEIDLLGKTVKINDQSILLTRTEYELLLFFISNKNRVVSKASIAEHISGEMSDLLDNHDFIYSHIKNLKAKLAKSGIKSCIKTVYGAGYKWTEN
ncbi:response regulator transcription factor [Succinatimonas hippei]|uniref:response regulator transcription factor n=1 Tax=Succinatimonas hippei TaxID=626938 RepID=UPI0020137F72|nr:response regulator transcription factor [Succinatimonas hippei]MCL1602904.1 response regulator transcription factor [Succinatimonas hippei]